SSTPISRLYITASAARMVVKRLCTAGPPRPFRVPIYVTCFAVPTNRRLIGSRAKLKTAENRAPAAGLLRSGSSAAQIRVILCTAQRPHGDLTLASGRSIRRSNVLSQHRNAPARRTPLLPDASTRFGRFEGYPQIVDAAPAIVKARGERVWRAD